MKKISMLLYTFAMVSLIGFTIVIKTKICNTKTDSQKETITPSSTKEILPKIPYQAVFGDTKLSMETFEQIMQIKQEIDKLHGYIKDKLKEAHYIIQMPEQWLNEKIKTIINALGGAPTITSIAQEILKDLELVESTETVWDKHFTDELESLKTLIKRKKAAAHDIERYNALKKAQKEYTKEETKNSRAKSKKKVKTGKNKN